MLSRPRSDADAPVHAHPASKVSDFHGGDDFAAADFGLAWAFGQVASERCKYASELPRSAVVRWPADHLAPAAEAEAKTGWWKWKQFLTKKKVPAAQSSGRMRPAPTNVPGGAGVHAAAASETAV